MQESSQDNAHKHHTQFSLSLGQDLMSMPLKFRIVSRLKTGSQAVLFSDPDLAHWPMHGPQAFASTIPPISSKAFNCPSRLIV